MVQMLNNLIFILYLPQYDQMWTANSKYMIDNYCSKSLTLDYLKKVITCVLYFVYK